MSACRFCHRAIVLVDDVWIDPAATGDDVIWRATCDKHDTFTAEHEPEVVEQEHLVEGLNWLHALVQELENAKVELPMGDYMRVYAIIEDAREYIDPSGEYEEHDEPRIDWTPTHQSVRDGSEVRFVGLSDDKHVILANEDGEEFAVTRSEWMHEWEPVSEDRWGRSLVDIEAERLGWDQS